MTEERVHNGYHLMGHRVRIVSFRECQVECDCGEVMVVPDDESRMIRDESLAVAFTRHRREVSIQAGFTQRRNAPLTVSVWHHGQT